MMPIYVWLYCIAWWFVQDWVKVLSYVAMDRFNIFQYRTFMDPDTPAVAPTTLRVNAGASPDAHMHEKQPLISKH
jgi:hypothetical protein